MYNTQVLNSVESCDTILQEAQHEKSSLQFRKTKLLKLLSGSSGNLAQTQQEYDDVTAEVTEITAELETLAEGPFKTKKIAEQHRLISKQLHLEIRLGQSSSETNMERQHELKRIDVALTEIDAYMLAVETRKTELQS